MILQDEIFPQEQEQPRDISCNSVKIKQNRLSLDALYDLFKTNKTELIKLLGMCISADLAHKKKKILDVFKS